MTRELHRPRPFSGGLALRPYKALSTETPVTKLAMPDQLVIALAQHSGPPAQPTVTPGQQVTCGQMIGSASAPGAVAVHASAAGTVLAIEDRFVPTGTRLIKSLCVILGTNTPPVDVDPPGDTPWPGDSAERLRTIRDGGLVGLGGAAFPTATKLASGQRCNTLILNGAECEPYISCDDVLMREHAGSVLDGALIMLELLQAERCIVAIERDKTAALAAVRAALQSRNDDRLVLAPIATVYPAGGERQLVESLLGEEVPSGGYPTDLGVVCQNVGTAHALAELAARGRPLLSRIVTVTGHGLVSPQNVDAPIGAPIKALIAHCGGLTDDACQLILGGNMMGYALPNDDIPVTKSTNCVIALPINEARLGGPEWPCIRCGDCASACPARLLPQELLRAARETQFKALGELGLADCIECGLCDLVCPSHIPLTAVLRNAKHDLDIHLDHMRRAEVAEDRHLRRLAREAQLADASRQAQERLKASLGSDAASRQAAIDAAIDRATQRRDDGAERDE